MADLLTAVKEKLPENYTDLAPIAQAFFFALKTRDAMNENSSFTHPLFYEEILSLVPDLTSDETNLLYIQYFLNICRGMNYVIEEKDSSFYEDLKNTNLDSPLFNFIHDIPISHPLTLAFKTTLDSRAFLIPFLRFFNLNFQKNCFRLGSALTQLLDNRHKPTTEIFSTISHRGLEDLTLTQEHHPIIHAHNTLIETNAYSFLDRSLFRQSSLYSYIPIPITDDYPLDIDFPNYYSQAYQESYRQLYELAQENHGLFIEPFKIYFTTKNADLSAIFTEKGILFLCFNISPSYRHLHRLLPESFFIVEHRNRFTFLPFSDINEQQPQVTWSPSSSLSRIFSSIEQSDFSSLIANRLSSIAPHFSRAMRRDSENPITFTMATQFVTLNVTSPRTFDQYVLVETLLKRARFVLQRPHSEEDSSTVSFDQENIESHPQEQNLA